MKNINDICKTGNLISFKKAYKEAILPIFIIDEDGNTPLHNAIINENFEIAEYLIKNDLFQNSRNKDGLTPIELTLKNNSPDYFALFADKYSDNFLSGIINSSDIQKDKKNQLINLFNYSLGVMFVDIMEYYKNNENVELDLEDLSYILKEKIKELDNHEVKKLISYFYKNHPDYIKDELEEILLIAIVVNNYEVVDFIKNVFDIKAFDLSEKGSEFIFKGANIEGIHYLIENFKVNDFSKYRYFVNRGSIGLLELFIDKYHLDLNTLNKEELLMANSDKKYFDFITKQIEIDRHALFNLIVDYSSSFNEDKKTFVKNFILENKDVILMKDVNNVNFLAKILKNENYEIIEFVINELGFMLNELDNKFETPIVSLMSSMSSDIFELLITNKSTNLNLFDKNVDNIMHKMIKNKENIIDFDIKFKMLSKLIDNDILLLTNKDGKTPLFLLVENEMIEEIKNLILLEVINEENVNYPSLGKTLGNYYDINCLNVQPLKKEKNKNVMTSENLEDGVIKQDLVYLSKVLFEMDFKKSRIMRVEHNGFMNKAKNFETVLLLSIYNFDINGINEEEVETPLMLAIKRHDEGCALFLLSQQCQVNTKIDNETPLLIAFNEKMENVLISILKKKPEENLFFLKNTIYENYIKLSYIPREKIIKLDFNKENIKSGLFDKNEKLGYKIHKGDSKETIFKKELLNIYEVAKNFEDLFKICDEKNIKYEVLFLGFKFFNIDFKNKDNLHFNFNEIGLSRDEVKQKLKYDYFKLKNK